MNHCIDLVIQLSRNNNKKTATSMKTANKRRINAKFSVGAQSQTVDSGVKRWPIILSVLSFKAKAPEGSPRCDRNLRRRNHIVPSCNSHARSRFGSRTSTAQVLSFSRLLLPANGSSSQRNTTSKTRTCACVCVRAYVLPKGSSSYDMFPCVTTRCIYDNYE